MRRWYSSTSLYLNNKYGKRGQVYLEKTKRGSVKIEERPFSLLCYIHHNPIHHGLTTSYEAWSYSTYLEYMSNNTGPGSVEILKLLGDGDQQKGKSLFLRMHEMYQTNFEK